MHLGEGVAFKVLRCVVGNVLHELRNRAIRVFRLEQRPVISADGMYVTDLPHP